MNLLTVITNLKRTIAGKEEALALYESRRDIPRVASDQMAIVATIEFLKINIDELKRILDDLVEVSIKGINLSWQQSPDRSGGQFTDEEINRANEWH